MSLNPKSLLSFVTGKRSRVDIVEHLLVDLIILTYLSYILSIINIGNIFHLKPSKILSLNVRNSTETTTSESETGFLAFNDTYMTLQRETPSRVAWSSSKSKKDNCQTKIPGPNILGNILCEYRDNILGQK